MARDPKTGQLQKGTVLNPKGRPPGSRNKIEEDFLKDVYAEWKAGGRDAVADMRENNPADFVKMVAGLLPKNVKLDGEIKHTWLDVLKRINDERTDSPGQRPALESEPESVRH